MNIGILVPVCSRNRDYNTFEASSFANVFIKAFERTRSDNYTYRIFVGIDDNDDFFRDNISKLTSDIHPVILKDCNHKPAKAWNILLEEAYKSGCDYFLQIGDDVELITEKWTERFIEKLISMDNVGIVGPCETGNYNYRKGVGKPIIIENVFFHRKHYEIFHTLFHKNIDNWYCDDWIFKVYNYFDKAFMFLDITCKNTIRYNRYDYTENIDNLEEYISEGVQFLSNYLNVLPNLKIGLNMIVKNEAHIILEGLNCIYPLIDTYVIVDTGSTDDTKDVVKNFFDSKGIQGKIYDEKWEDFGTNRSQALKLCDGKMDYALVLDADDLISFPNDGKKTLLAILKQHRPNGINFMIHQHDLRYYRVQMFKMNDGWKYVGVLHEYATNNKADNTILNIPEHFYMTSRRLGDRSRSADKMKRDIEILLKGLDKEPENERYVFYLAQSYRDDGNLPKAIEYYKKRVFMRKWIEEMYFSAYQIAKCYMDLGNIVDAEYWAQKATEIYPKRAEALYLLAKHFRTVNKFHKAYHYIEEGRKIAYPENDILFIEKFPHEGGFDYEASIVEYYIFSDKKKGLRSCFEYLSKRDDFKDNVISNMKFYVEKIKSEHFSLKIYKNFFGELFSPSAVSIVNYPYANVRYVNYFLENGNYNTKNGSKIVTKNLFINLESGEGYEMKTDTPPLFDSIVLGIEDIRSYAFNDKHYFTATSYKEYIENQISIVHGEYDIDKGLLRHIKGIKSPYNQVEKNWLNIAGTDDFVYSWHPLRIGKIRDDKIIFFKTIDTPRYFSLFRGSSPGISIDDQLYFLVHIVEYSKQRKYYHMFVKIEKDTYKILGTSLPFYFQRNEIEYCLSTRWNDEQKYIECYVSLNDRDPCKICIRLDDINWL